MSQPKNRKKQSNPSKRYASSEHGYSSFLGKAAKVLEDTENLALDSRGGGNEGAAQTGGPIDAGGKRTHEEADIYTETKGKPNKIACMINDITIGSAENTDAHPTTSTGRPVPTAVGDAGDSEMPMDAPVAGASGSSSLFLVWPGHVGLEQQSDWAAIAAAEALASLTRGDVGARWTERPYAGNQEESKKNGKRPGTQDSKACDMTAIPKARMGSKSRVAAADRPTALPKGGAALDTDTDTDTDTGTEVDEEDDDTLLSSSTSNYSSETEDVNAEDSECSIVSVKIVPETRQAVAQLACLQMQLDTLERKGARQHQRLELRLSKQRRLHMDQRGAFINEIPGFWRTALLNHPQLSCHIDENDEDALSYMTNLEIEKNSLGCKIGFHFRRNRYFQNNTIVKELHVALSGSNVSFSNTILWHRGQNLIARGRLAKSPDAFHPNQSFFAWFSDHSTPDKDEIAEILKNDLYRNPLRYYLTPLWESRVDGSVPRLTNRVNLSECLVISDSDDGDDEEERGPGATLAGHVQEAEMSSVDEDEDEDEDEVVVEGSEEGEGGEMEEEDRVGQVDEEELDVEGAGESDSTDGTVLEDEGNIGSEWDEEE